MFAKVEKPALPAWDLIALRRLRAIEITPHISHLSLHPSHLTPHTSHLTPHCSYRHPLTCMFVWVPNGGEPPCNLLTSELTDHSISHTSHITHHTSHIIPHMSFLICHSSYLTRHTSYVIHHQSYVTPHTSPVTPHASYTVYSLSPPFVRGWEGGCRGRANSMNYFAHRRDKWGSKGAFSSRFYHHCCPPGGHN